MKYTLYIFLLLLTSCSSQKTNDLDKMNLKGNIKSIQEETRHSNGELSMTKIFYFTSSGMIKSEELCHYPVIYSRKTINYYDFQGNINKQDLITDDSIYHIKEYIYLNPKKDSILFYDSKDNLIINGVYKYNDARQIIESKLIDLQDKMLTTETSKYDDKNRLIKIKETNLEISYGYTYSYDSLGRIQTSTLFVYDSVKKIRRFSYDETDHLNNWITKRAISSNGVLLSIVSRKIEYR